MKSPQLANGYTPLANELLEALALSSLSGNEFRIILIVIRETYGYHHKVCSLGNTQIALKCALRREVVGVTIRRLIAKNILLRFEDSYVHGLALNKDYSSWGKKGVLVNSSGNLENSECFSHEMDVLDGNPDTIFSAKVETPRHQFGAKVETPRHQFGAQSGNTTTPVLDQSGNTTTPLSGNTTTPAIKGSKDSKKINTTTTTYCQNLASEKKEERGGGFFEEKNEKEVVAVEVPVLCFSAKLSDEERAFAKKILLPCGCDAQSVLDVMSAAMLAGRVQTSPLALLSGLVRRYESGSFDPAPGLRIKSKRENTPVVARKEEKNRVIDTEGNKLRLAQFKQDLHLR